MALTKTEIVDKIEVVTFDDWSMVQVRTATVSKRMTQTCHDLSIGTLLAQQMIGQANQIK